MTRPPQRRSRRMNGLRQYSCHAPPESVLLRAPRAERDGQDAEAGARGDAQRLPLGVGHLGDRRGRLGARDDLADPETEQRVADHVVVAGDDRHPTRVELDDPDVPERPRRVHRPVEPAGQHLDVVGIVALDGGVERHVTGDVEVLDGNPGRRRESERRRREPLAHRRHVPGHRVEPLANAGEVDGAVGPAQRAALDEQRGGRDHRVEGDRVRHELLVERADQLGLGLGCVHRFLPVSRSTCSSTGVGAGGCSSMNVVPMSRMRAPAKKPWRMPRSIARSAAPFRGSRRWRKCASAGALQEDGEHRHADPEPQAHELVRERAEPEPVAEVQLGVGVALARVHVVDHAGGVVHDRVAGVEHAAEHVEVLGAGELSPGAEHVVEAAELEHQFAPEGHHRAVPRIEALDRARVPAGRSGRLVAADERVVEHPPGDRADRRVGESGEDRVDPPLDRDAVVIGEQHQRTLGGAEPDVACDREPADVAAHVHGARRRRDLAGLPAVGRGVDHDDLDVVGNGARDGPERVGEHRRTVPRADDDGELTRRRHAAPRR